MSVAALLQAAVLARLRAAPALAGIALFDAPPVRAALPYAQLDEPLCTDWSTKSWAGREARVAVSLFDGGERPLRLRELAAAAEGALLSVDGTLADGWQVASVALVRSRIVRGAERWTAAVEVRVRVYQQTGDE